MIPPQLSSADGESSAEIVKIILQSKMMLPNYFRFSRRLLALVATLVLVPQVLTFLNAEQGIRSGWNEEQQRKLKQALVIVQDALNARLDALAGAAVAAVAAAKLKSLEGTVIRRPTDFILIFGESDSSVVSEGALPPNNFLPRLRGELATEAIRAGELEGVLLVGNNQPLAFHAIPAPSWGKGYWCVAGHYLDREVLEGWKTITGFDLAMIAFATKAPQSQWQVVRSTLSAEGNTLLQQVGGRVAGPFFRYGKDENTTLAHLAMLQLSGGVTPIGIILQTNIGASPPLLGAIWEACLLSFALSLALGIVGLVVYQSANSLQLQTIQTHIRDVKEGKGSNPLDPNAFDLLRDTVRSINELTYHLVTERADAREGKGDIEQKNYELERKTFELKLLNRLLHCTNFVPDQTEALGAALEEIMRTYSAELGAIYRRNNDDLGLRSVLAKRFVRNTGILASGREVTAQFAALDPKEVTQLEAGAATAISRGAIWREDLNPAMNQGRQAVGLPFKQPDGTSAALILVVGTGEYFFTQSDLSFFETLGLELTSILRASRKNDSSVLDPLTQLNNHRYFLQQLNHEISRARRSNAKISLLTLEIDQFRNFAERNEWAEGETVIKDTATVMRGVCRSTDILSRRDGANFLILLPDTAAEGAAVVAEKLRMAVENNVVASKRGPIKVTLSLGAAIFPLHAILPKDLIDIAAQALLNAQKLGGNRASVPNAAEAGKTAKVTPLVSGNSN